jgi:hypothetical protein
MNKFLNAILFQLGWFICVSSVAYDLEWIALGVCGFLVGLYLINCNWKREEILTLMIVLPSGIALDSMLEYFHIIDFYGWRFLNWSPFWDWMIWTLFTLTLRSSLDFMKNLSVWIKSLIGLFCAPLSYIAGYKLHAAQLNPSFLNLAIIGVSWMIALPLMLEGVQFLDRDKMNADKIRQSQSP